MTPHPALPSPPETRRPARAALLAGLLLGAACAPSVREPSACAEPRLIASDLRVGDGALDISTGAAFADLDGDGDLDLISTAEGEGIGIWVDDGHGRYTAVADTTLRARRDDYSSIATGDLDGDGDVDVVLGNRGERPGGAYATVLTNESVPCGRPVRVQLRDRSGAPDPIGARVTLVSRGPEGERSQLRESMGQTTWRGQSASAFLFSLPDGERALRLEVRWPDGGTQSLRPDLAKPNVVRRRR